MHEVKSHWSATLGRQHESTTREPGYRPCCNRSRGGNNMDTKSTVFQPGRPVAMRVSIRIVYLVLTLFLVFGIESPPLFGQQQGKLSGTVRDPLGALVVN